VKIGDLVNYRVITDELTGKEEVGTAVVYEKLSQHRYLIFTNRGDTIDISQRYTEVISESR